MIAALFVQTGGAYFGLPNVDPWDAKRDARGYAGPFPVVAHPPCSRWCKLAHAVQGRYEVAQSAYGHRALKRTWLLYVGANPPPELDWSQPEGTAVVGHDAQWSITTKKPRLWKREASATPPAFRDTLIALAEQSMASKQVAS